MTFIRVVVCQSIRRNSRISRRLGMSNLTVSKKLRISSIETMMHESEV